jgi:hypothetical protein
MSTSQPPFQPPFAGQIEDIEAIIDTIVKLTRPKQKADVSPAITPEERTEVMRKALGTYRMLNEKRIENKGRILIEYQKDFQEITEEIVLEAIPEK